MAGLIMGMFADTGAPLAPFVFATDAQGHDDGVTGAVMALWALQ